MQTLLLVMPLTKWSASFHVQLMCNPFTRPDKPDAAIRSSADADFVRMRLPSLIKPESGLARLEAWLVITQVQSEKARVGTSRQIHASRVETGRILSRL